MPSYRHDRLRATAPGKIILFGEHSVVYENRRAIAAAVSGLRVHVSFQSENDEEDPPRAVTSIWNATDETYDERVVKISSMENLFRDLSSEDEGKAIHINGTF